MRFKSQNQPKEADQVEDGRGGDEERARQPMMDEKQHRPMIERTGTRSRIVS